MNRLIFTGIVALVLLVAGGVAARVCGVAPATADAPVVAPLTEGHTLTIETRDGSTLATIATRVGVLDSASGPVAPPDPEASLFQSLFMRSYFYSEGVTSLVVPPGPVTVRVGRGFEYLPAETTLVVAGDTTVVVDLDRFTDMNAAGWYAADTHMHISHPPVVYNVQPSQVITVMDAEGLNVVNSMEELPYFTGALHPASTPDRLLYFSKEERNAHFGHLSLVGLKQWIPDQTCHDLDHACGRTLISHIAETVRAQGPHTLIIATHPLPTFDFNDISPWPGGGVWRSMPIDLLGGHVDAVDIMNYTHALPPTGSDDYFHALNCGFRVAPSAGSDAVLGNGGTPPVGGYRVYAQLGAGPLEFDEWVEAMRAGRTFVTNYPLITTFTVAGTGPGGEVEYAGAPLPVHVAASCALPFDRVELIADGTVIHTIDVSPGATELDTTVALDPGDAGWMMARVRGVSGGWHVVDANGLFAQTAPVYLAASTSAPSRSVMTTPGFDPLQLATHRFRALTEDAVAFFNLAELTAQGRAEFDSMTTHAIDYYLGAWPDPPSDFDLVSPLNVSWYHGRSWVQTLTPTFRWRRAIDPDPGDIVTYEFQLDSDYQFDDPMVTEGILDTIFVVPPEYGLVDQEIYYWRVFAVDPGGNRRLSTPGWWTFVIDMVTVDAGEGPPLAWGLRSAHPNPFNPVLHVSYAVPVEAGEHTVAVYDIRGAHVRTLFNGSRPPGVYEERWDGRDATGAEVASGVYFVRLRPAAGAAVTRKVVLLK